ncbi:MAG: uroporphyrinogen-III synthase [Planctomycetes bacterium]|nr:uroporphyrinogen-III synthase [Planctomycetota bacterium]
MNRPVRVLSFESRKADEMRSLIERQGGVAFVAPSMREIPLEENPAALDFARRLLDGEVDVVIFMTGVGARALLEAVETQFDRAQFFAALGRTTNVVRGPKPTVELRSWGVPIHHRAADPNTWREVLAELDAHVALAGAAVAVQEYGEPSDELYAALRHRGAQVLAVPVYRWGLPEDTGPLVEAIRKTVAGEFDVVLVTSAQQIANVVEVARQEGVEDAWRGAVSRCVVASIGPTASDALRSAGLPVHVEASPPKMGQLVQAGLSEARDRFGSSCVS